jgi:hypothetical protein
MRQKKELISRTCELCRARKKTARAIEREGGNSADVGFMSEMSGISLNTKDVV